MRSSFKSCFNRSIFFLRVSAKVDIQHHNKLIFFAFYVDSDASAAVMRQAIAGMGLSF